MPHLRVIMDAVTDPAVREIWVMKSAQIGWTETLSNVVGYHIDQDPAPILLVQPTIDMAETYSKDRLAPMLRDSPCFVGKVQEARSRDSGNTLLHKSFPGGHITMAGANAPSGLAMRPIRIVLLDEVDRFPASAGTEGDPVRLAAKRMTAFWNRKLLVGSTPTIKGISRIEAGFMSSDQRHLHVPCPDCNAYQKLVWAQVKWTDNNPATARYCCSACGVLWDDMQRIDAVARACREDKWIAEKPFDGIMGIHMWEIHSPLVTMEEMVRGFIEAKKLPETLKTWVNTSRGETWEEAGTTIEPGSLLERRESYGPENIPDQVLLLTAGCDVQDDRVEVLLTGWGVDEESWPIEQKVFRGDPGKQALWLEVDEYLKQRFVREDGRQMLIEAVAVDSGGHCTQAVYDFVVARKRRRIWAIKGMAGPGRLAWPKKASRTAKSRASVFIVGVDTIKGVLYGRLSKVHDPGPGYIHLPASADADFCAQLTSEKSLTKYARGRPVQIWEPRSKGIRQEVQDCWVYAYAAFIGRGGPEFIKRLAARKEKTHLPPQTLPAAAADVAPRPLVDVEAVSRQQRQNFFNPTRRKNWVRSW